MATINAYLSFEGNCEEAFNFYKSVFGGDFTYIGRFSDMPPQEGIPPLDDDMKEKIMHISLPLSKETILMGSDTGDWGPKLTKGNNISLSINTSSKEEADRIFNALSEGGEITMPIDNTFWNAYFGMLKDRFGFNWMTNFDPQPKH